MFGCRRIALAILLLAVSLPVWAGVLPECRAQLRAAPRACCGSHCACAKSACLCRPEPAPAGPAAAPGALLPASTFSDPHASWVPGLAIHPAVAPVTDAAVATRYAERAASSAAPNSSERLVTLQI